MASRPVYIAGVGTCHLTATSSKASVHDIVISAATKALLDAGITYNEVKQNVACFLGRDLRVGRSSFDFFGKTGAPVTEIDCYSGLSGASHFVKSGDAECTLLIGFDRDRSRRIWQSSKIIAVAFVLVSKTFLTSHSYLKDSSALILGSQVASPVHSRASSETDEALATKAAVRGALHQAMLLPEDIQIVELRHGAHASAQQALGELNVSEDGSASPVSHPFVGSTGLAGLCELVWQLRGWTKDRSVPQTRNCLQYTMGPDGTACATVLCRHDQRSAPSWEEIEHLKDGRERLAHNPALETKETTFEDWQAVKAPDNFVLQHTEGRLGLPKKGGDRAALSRL